MSKHDTVAAQANDNFVLLHNDRGYGNEETTSVVSDEYKNTIEISAWLFGTC